MSDLRTLISPSSKVEGIEAADATDGLDTSYKHPEDLNQVFNYSIIYCESY